jgi:hypothetical protein
MIVESIHSEIRFLGASAPRFSLCALRERERQRTHSPFKRFINLQNTHQKSAQVHVLHIKHSLKYTGM